MDIYDKFKIIEARFKALDDGTRARLGKPFFDTEHGIWGASAMDHCFELFMRIRLDERKGFVDLGSGDGRIVLIAALFTDSCGIEGDDELSATASRIREELLQQIPELARCQLRSADYTREDLSAYDTLFTFADHPWNPDFERKLENECKGVLLSYNKIFLPNTLKKGKTYWVQQLPIISYPLNVEEEDLFQEMRGQEMRKSGE
jgi:hypothetical protein